MQDSPVIEKVNVIEKLNSFQGYWSPKILGEINDRQAGSTMTFAALRLFASLRETGV
jgi:hypothetical protein